MAKTSESALRAVKKYDAAHKEDYKLVQLKLHKEKDADIIDKLNQEGNKNGYIKKLIRDDLSK